LKTRLSYEYNETQAEHDRLPLQNRSKRANMPKAPVKSRWYYYVAIFLFVFAVLLNGFFIFQFFPPDQFGKYTIAAKMVLQNELPTERLLDFSPSYLYLHVLVHKFFSNPIKIIQWIHIILIAFSTLLLYFLLLNFFRFAIALFGSIAFILNHSLITHVQAFEPEPMVVFLLLGFLFFIHRAGLISRVGAGLFFGLGILTRPNFLPVLLAIPIYFFIKREEYNNQWLKPTLQFSIPVLICLCVLWGRSSMISGSFSITTMNPGTVFFEGNNPNSWGHSSKYPLLVEEISRQYQQQPDYQHEAYRIFARSVAQKQLPVSKVNEYWASKAFNFIQDHPKRFAQLILKKILYIYHSYEWHDLYNSFWNENKLQNAKIPGIPFWLLSAMALIGLLIQKSAWKEYLLFYVILFAQMILMLVFYVSARQRVAILFIFIFFACATLQFVIKNSKRFLVILALVPLCFLFWLKTDFMREDHHLWEATKISNDFLNASYRSRSANDFKEAARLSALALAAAPWKANSRRPSNLAFEPEDFEHRALLISFPQTFSRRFDRASLCIQAGQIEEAESLIKGLIEEAYEFNRDYYQSSEPNYYLGLIASQRYTKSLAIELLERGLKRSPGDPSILSLLTVLTDQAEFRNKLFRYFDDISAHFYLGKAQLESGKPIQAIEDFSYVVNNLKNYRNGHIYLAAALGEAGRDQEAATRYLYAIGMQPDPVFMERRIVPIFKRLSEKNPENAFSVYSYGIVLRQFGHYQQAMQKLQSALKLDPSNSNIKQEIAFLEKIQGVPRDMITRDNTD